MNLKQNKCDFCKTEHFCLDDQAVAKYWQSLSIYFPYFIVHDKSICPICAYKIEKLNYFNNLVLEAEQRAVATVGGDSCIICLKENTDLLVIEQCLGPMKYVQDFFSFNTNLNYTQTCSICFECLFNIYNWSEIRTVINKLKKIRISNQIFKKPLPVKELKDKMLVRQNNKKKRIGVVIRGTSHNILKHAFKQCKSVESLKKQRRNKLRIPQNLDNKILKEIPYVLINAGSQVNVLNILGINEETVTTEISACNICCKNFNSVEAYKLHLLKHDKLENMIVKIQRFDVDEYHNQNKKEESVTESEVNNIVKKWLETDKECVDDGINEDESKSVDNDKSIVVASSEESCSSGVKEVENNNEDEIEKNSDVDNCNIVEESNVSICISEDIGKLPEDANNDKDAPKCISNESDDHSKDNFDNSNEAIEREATDNISDQASEENCDVSERASNSTTQIEEVSENIEANEKESPTVDNVHQINDELSEEESVENITNEDLEENEVRKNNNTHKDLLNTRDEDESLSSKEEEKSEKKLNEQEQETQSCSDLPSETKELIHSVEDQCEDEKSSNASNKQTQFLEISSDDDTDNCEYIDSIEKQILQIHRENDKEETLKNNESPMGKRKLKIDEIESDSLCISPSENNGNAEKCLDDSFVSKRKKVRFAGDD